MAQKTVLGKGLASLLPGAAASAVVTAGAGVPSAVVGNQDRHPGIALLPVDDLVANDYQPRRGFDDSTLQQLAQSIKANGLIQPLIVRRTANGYQLIAGERRLRASKLAGLKQVPVVVRRSTDREALEMALVENIQREDLNCIDEALAYRQLMDEFQLTQEEAASRVGKERASVANYLRLLRLPEDIINDLKKGALTFGHGKAILMLEEQRSQLELWKKIKDSKLSVRQAESEAQALREKQAATGSQSLGAAGALSPQDPIQQRLSHISQDLTRQWSAKVELKGSQKRGKIVIHYEGAEQLERLLSVMQSSKLWESPRA